VRRTQLYIEDDLWKVLQIRSRESGSTISELVRQALRERYFSRSVERGRSMRAIIGIRKDRPEINDPESYIRKLRGGTRLSRLA
jgi:hypothetical protein